jgi:hypothetical protein
MYCLSVGVGLDRPTEAGLGPGAGPPWHDVPLPVGRPERIRAAGRAKPMPLSHDITPRGNRFYYNAIREQGKLFY